MPVYNERETLGTVVTAITGVLPHVEKEVIIIDDCSTDGTREWLQENFSAHEGKIAILPQNFMIEHRKGDANIAVQVIYHERNKGKGGALQTGFAAAHNQIVIIQDADLEYDPQDWVPMYDLIAVRQVADVVYGSRFYGRPHRSLFYHHYLANRLISVLFNILYNQTLTDIETCYKMIRREVLLSLRLSANDFGIEVEISSQIARQPDLRIYELGISYYGRTYQEGKKINWKDGLKALWYLVKFRFG